MYSVLCTVGAVVSTLGPFPGATCSTNPRPTPTKTCDRKHRHSFHQIAVPASSMRLCLPSRPRLMPPLRVSVSLRLSCPIHDTCCITLHCVLYWLSNSRLLYIQYTIYVTVYCIPYTLDCLPYTVLYHISYTIYHRPYHRP